MRKITKKLIEIISLVFVMGVHFAWSADWKISNIEEGRLFYVNSNNRYLVIDQKNQKHVAYGGDHLYLMSFDGPNSQIATIDNQPGAGSTVSMALDNFGFFHIAYTVENKILKYATNSNGSWVIQTIESSQSDVFQNISLALDTSDKPHLVYFRSDSEKIIYQNRVAQDWTGEIELDNGDLSNSSVSIAMDSDDNYHVCFYNRRNSNEGDLVYLSDKSVFKKIRTVIDSGVNEKKGLDCSLALDSNDKVHISYNDETNNDLKYATNSNGSWQKEIVDTQSSDRYFTSISVDSNSKVHISYSDTNSGLKYATGNFGNWILQNVDTDLQSGYYSSLALDANNKASIVYFDDLNRFLKITDNVTSNWRIKTLDQSHQLAGPTSIFETNSGFLTALYTDSTGYTTLKISKNESGVWISDSYFENQISQLLATAINGNVLYVAYVDNQTGHLIIAENSNGTFYPEVINAQYHSYGKGKMFVDSSNYVHLFYFNSTLDQFIYATNKTNGWIFKTISNYEIVDNDAVMDSSGNFHLILRDETNEQLKYLTDKSGQWVEDLIEENIESRGVALSVDNKGFAHASYRNEDNHLIYSNNTTGNWVHQIIDENTNTTIAKRISMVMDSSQKIHIVYDAGDNGGIKYATNDSGNWIVETLVNDRTINSLNLILDSDRKLNLVFCDDAISDVFYAELSLKDDSENDLPEIQIEDMPDFGSPTPGTDTGNPGINAGAENSSGCKLTPSLTSVDLSLLFIFMVNILGLIGLKLKTKS